jgi:hypothetical protein
MSEEKVVEMNENEEEIKISEEEIKEIKKVIEENEDELIDIYDSLESYVEGEFDIKTLEELCDMSKECSDYVYELSKHIETRCFVIDTYNDFCSEDYKTKIEELLLSKNKEEFLQRFKVYLVEMDSRLEDEAKCYEENCRDEARKKILCYELIEDFEEYCYTHAVLVYDTCCETSYLSLVVMCKSEEKADKIADLILDRFDVEVEVVDLKDVAIEDVINNEYVEKYVELVTNRDCSLDSLEIVDARRQEEYMKTHKALYGSYYFDL